VFAPATLTCQAKGYSRDVCRLLVEAYPELGDRIGNWFRGE